jgi:hypothetical protein
VGPCTHSLASREQSQYAWEVLDTTLDSDTKGLSRVDRTPYATRRLPLILSPSSHHHRNPSRTSTPGLCAPPTRRVHQLTACQDDLTPLGRSMLGRSVHRGFHRHSSSLTRCDHSAKCLATFNHPLTATKQRVPNIYNQFYFFPSCAGFAFGAWYFADCNCAPASFQ